METEEALQVSVVSLVEDVLQQHNDRLSDFDFASRKAEETASRRYEAASWLRQMVGVVGGKDLPAEPSEEDFRLGLRSGIILCNVINKVQPGAVAKVIEAHVDAVVIPDGAALSAFQYFENVRNFLVAVEEMGLPNFEASDLEKGGKSTRIVNCVLALKSFHGWKQSGGSGPWRYGGNSKPPSSVNGRQFLRRNSEPFMKSLSRTSSLGEKSFEHLSNEQSLSSEIGQELSEGGGSNSMNTLVRSLLSDKKQEEIPTIVESMLSKVMEEFERRLANQNLILKTSQNEVQEPGHSNVLSRSASTNVIASCEVKRQDEEKEEEAPTQTKEEEEEAPTQTEEEEAPPQTTEVDNDEEALTQTNDAESESEECHYDEEAAQRLLKQQTLVEKQKIDILELKQTLQSTKAGMQFMQMKYKEEINNLGKHLYGLTTAAAGYRRVLEENRKLYNQVQDLKGNIRVYCRVRPFMPGQPQGLSTVDNIEEGTITIATASKNVKDAKKSFTFNKVFGPSATQAEVFSDTQPLIRSVLDGYNVCIFAYGQTGSGKTFTMTGPKVLTEESYGVNYRALNDLFVLSSQRKDTICYDISVQMLEIYNEQVRDLLSTDGQTKRLEIRNSSQNGINVPDATLVPVSSPSDVLYLMDLGHKNRAVSSTAMNDRSSRSHSCLTVHVQGRELSSGNTLRGSMHLVDLAGSERVDKSEVTGDRLKEAQHINKSLSALGDVIASLASKNGHVPYRNSKLTQLLQDALGGQAKTLMFIHVSPEGETLGETISTLKFAERVGTIELGAARVNKGGSEVKELKEQIVNLKAALAKKDTETDFVQGPRAQTPDKYRRKSLGFSSSPSKTPSLKDFSSGNRRQAEDINGIEVRSDSASSRRNSLDLQEITSSPSWPSPSFDGKDDDRESVSGDSVNKDENWEAENRQLPGKLCQGFSREATKVYPEQSLDKVPSNPTDSNIQEFEVQRIRYEVTDESDEAATTTSDCSETDMMWQLNVQVNVPRTSSLPSSLSSKTKKAQPKSVKDNRSMIPSLIPPPTKKLPSSGQKSGRQQGVAADGKRRAGHAK